MASHLGMSLSDLILRIEERELSLQKQLDRVRQEKETLVSAHAIAQSYMSSDNSAPAASKQREFNAGKGERNDDEAKPIPARIGTKRYLMLIAIRQFGTLGDQDIAEATSLELRHVRQQMKTDIDKGAVSMDDETGEYTLTDEGLDLLDRFESYRSSNGKTLPTLPIENDDTEHKNPDQMADGLRNGSSLRPPHSQEGIADALAS